MSLADTIRASLAIVGTIMGQSVVVIIGGVTGSGVQSSTTTASDMIGPGQRGSAVSRVRVSQATFPTAPEEGKAITVAGEDVIVTSVGKDAVAAMWVIDYTEQKTRRGI